jgi:hypothetical protein
MSEQLAIALGLILAQSLWGGGACLGMAWVWASMIYEDDRWSLFRMLNRR